MFADKVIDFYTDMDRNWSLPGGFELIDPFADAEVIDVFSKFYKKYFSQDRERVFLLGINPGRKGAGITGIPFTDPVVLQDVCGIDNSFDKKHELSAIFIHELVMGYGGYEAFYSHFYINSVCPLGFIKEGKNANYYDDRDLLKAVEPHIVEGISKQLDFGCSRKAMVSIGKGQNYKYLKALNDRYGWCEEVLAIPHPRWVMQYRRKSKDEHLARCVETLGGLVQDK
jgi:hypothetical protein